MIKRKSRIKKHVNATKIRYDDIEFQSKLEMYAYKEFKKEGIPAVYEKRSIQLIEPFVDPSPFYKVFGKSNVSERTNKVQGTIYTPDFEDSLNNPHYGFFIEIKGRRNESFPMRIKLFRLWRKRNEVNKDYFELSNEREIQQAIAIIKQNL
jgi:hypothetical protein